MRLRPAIDLHDGQVKQLVGGTLGSGDLRENFVSPHDAAYFAEVFAEKGLPGGHIILLNDREKEPLAYEADRQEALKALQSYPGGFQIGGGIRPEDAEAYLEAGASHVIVTSYLFPEGELSMERLGEMEKSAGREHLIVDLSCRRREQHYTVVTDRWQHFTKEDLNSGLLDRLYEHCGGFLIHGVDVEGTKSGIEEALAADLADWFLDKAGQERVPEMTYAGGIRALDDLRLIAALSQASLDVTVGSALSLFGGELDLDQVVTACEYFTALEHNSFAV